MIAIFLAVFLSFSKASFAQGPEPLSWNDCVQIALQKNPELLAARRALQASRFQYKGSFNSILPHVSFVNSYANSDTLAQIARYTNAANYQADGSVSLDIYNAQDYASIRTAEAQREQASASLRQILAQVRLELRLAFVQLLYAQAKIDVDRRIIELQKTNAEMVALEYKSGQESKGNMMTSDAQLLQSQVALTDDERTLRSTQSKLSHWLGQDDFSAVIATGALSPVDPEAKPDFASLVVLNPQVIIQKAAVVLAQAGLQNSEVALWPDLSASASRYYNGGRELPQTPHWSIGASLSIPIFGTGPLAAYYQIAASKQSLEQAKESLRETRNQARSSLEQDWSAYFQNVDLVFVNRKLFAAAVQRNDESTIRYNTGLMPFETWILAVEDVVNFQQSLLSAELNAANARAQWENAQGKILGE
ncbi:MAG: TolC family protein [Elusimicrobiota bacterium]